jgi:membrane-associated HD superfamily phosphohydrolase
MRERLSRLTSSILNPFLVSFIVIVLLAFKSAASTIDALKWASISIVLSVLPVFIIVIYLVRCRKLNSIFANPREQRHGIYILASVLGVIGCGVLWYFGAPELLAVTFTAGLIAIVIFTTINYFWKISLHTAFMAAAVVVLVMVYGAAAAWTFVLLPPVAWARMELKQHSWAQVATGAILAAVIVVGVFRGFGVVG